MSKDLSQILAGVFGLPASAITPELTKDDVGTWDSLKQMDLVLSLEQNYGVTLEIGDIVRMTSVAEIKAVLTDKGLDVAA